MSDVAVITGASRGIGRAITLRLAEEGHRLVINYRTNSEAAKSLEEEIKQNQGKDSQVILYQADVSDFETCKTMMEDVVNRWGNIDYLINNAGISKGGLLAMYSMEKWWQVMKVNLGGVVNCSKAVLKYMIPQKGGKIINIGSLSGIKGTVGNSDYTSSKAAIHGFTKSLAKEVARFNIQVNCIAPGFIKTDMTDEMPQKKKQNLDKMIPLKRMGRPEEVSEMVALMLTDKMDYMIGQVVVMCGGSSL